MGSTPATTPGGDLADALRTRTSSRARRFGWALRDYARTDPNWVRAFVADHPTLSPLSRREALTHL